MTPEYKSECYCTNLRRSANTITAYYDAALAASGLTAAQYYLLINLSRLKTANITRWAKRVGLDRSTMVRNLKTLQSRSLLERVAGNGKTYAISAQGADALAAAIPLWQQAQQTIASVLQPDDSAAVFRICENLQKLSTGQ